MSAEMTHRPIMEWMEIFSSIYANADRERTPEQVWIAIMAHTSQIGESIRTFSIESLTRSAAHTFCWLCSYINKCRTLENNIFRLEDDLCSVVTLKYPGVCGHCQGDPCYCDTVKIEKEPDKSAEYVSLLELRNRNLPAYQGYSVHSFLSMSKKIYAARLPIQTLESIGFHFLEEVGEAAVAVRELSQLRNVVGHKLEGLDQDFINKLTTVNGVVDNFQVFFKKKDPRSLDLTDRDPNTIKARIVRAKMAIIVEIGDTFSWFCSIMNKLSSIEESIWEEPEKHHDYKFLDLETALENEYFDNNGKAVCPTCKTSPCSCAFFNANPKA